MKLEFRETRPSDFESPDALPAGVTRWLCLDEARIVGNCSGDARTGEILSLSVLPGYEGYNIGKRLLSFVVDWLRTTGATRIWLAAPPNPTQRADGFYRAMGWLSTGETTEQGLEILELRLPQVPQ